MGRRTHGAAQRGLQPHEDGMVRLLCRFRSPVDGRVLPPDRDHRSHACAGSRAAPFVPFRCHFDRREKSRRRGCGQISPCGRNDRLTCPGDPDIRSASGTGAASTGIRGETIAAARPQRRGGRWRKRHMDVPRPRVRARMSARAVRHPCPGHCGPIRSPQTRMALCRVARNDWPRASIPAKYRREYPRQYARG